jgi:NAD(P)-dependent dehydrogenase (short-subunit alcohol dehydrogenase family)
MDHPGSPSNQRGGVVHHGSASVFRPEFRSGRELSLQIPLCPRRANSDAISKSSPTSNRTRRRHRRNALLVEDKAIRYTFARFARRTVKWNGRDHVTNPSDQYPPLAGDCALSQSSTAFRLDGQLALITGGGTGLGLAMGRCMAAAGARVILAARREAVLRAAVAEIGSDADYVVHDVDKLNEAPALVERVTHRWGPIGILVNNAGVHLKKPILETTEAEFLQVLTTHVLAAHALGRAVGPGMIERRSGSILFIASMASLMGIPNVVAYSAAKSAYVGMVRAMATEWSPHGVRVNALAPGWIETEMSRKAMAGDPRRRERILNRTPMARFGEPDDVGMAAVFLSSPAARFITGVVLPVDGGASIGF